MNAISLSEYIADPERRRMLADAAGTDPQYLWQIATGWRGKRASPALARAIERATNGAVTRYELRPDIFDAPPESGGKQAA